MCGAGETPALLDVLPDPPSRRLTVCSGVMFNAGRCQVDAYWLHLVTLFSSASQFPTWRPEDSGVSWWQLTAEAVARFSRGDAEFQVWQTANRLRRSLESTILYCTTLTHGSHGMDGGRKAPAMLRGLTPRTAPQPQRWRDARARSGHGLYSTDLERTSLVFVQVTYFPQWPSRLSAKLGEIIVTPHCRHCLSVLAEAHCLFRNRGLSSWARAPDCNAFLEDTGYRILAHL